MPRTVHAHIQDSDGNPPPAVENVIRYELGDLHGVRLTFSDATMLEQGNHPLQRLGQERGDG